MMNYQEKRAKQVRMSQSYALQIETILLNLRGIKHFMENGLELGVNFELTDDDIRPNPYLSLEENLNFYSTIHSKKAELIDEFLNKYKKIGCYKMDQILSIVDFKMQLHFDRDDDIDIENGEKYIIKMIEELENLVN